MFLIRRANSLPRLASTTAFLCLVVAHFEWPDIPSPPPSALPAPHQIHEVPVHTKITGQFGMEGGGEHVPLLNRDNPTGGHGPVEAAQHLDTRAGPLHPGRPDEHGVERATVDAA